MTRFLARLRGKQGNFMKTNKVFVNASWIIGCKVVQSGLALLINMMTARYFGPSNYGLINYAASLVAFVTPLMTLGTSDILVNEIINNPEKEGSVLGTSMVMTFCSSLFCVLGLSVFAWVTNPEDPTACLVVLLYSLLLVAQSVEQIQYWFQAKFLSKIVSVFSVIAYFLVSIYKIILLICKKSVCWFAVSNSIDYFLIALGLLIVYKAKKGQKLCFSKEMAISLWNKGKYYIIPGLMGLVLAQSDRIMIRFMCGDAEVGFYSAAINIAGLSSFVFSAIITSFRPAVLEAKEKKSVRYESCMIKLYGIVVYLALIQSIVIALGAQFAVGLLYGQAYLHSVPILRVVVWYTTFSYIGAVRSVWILAENKQNYLWIISFTGMLLNILLNLMLIPELQGTGAAIATTITQIFTNIIIVYWVKPLRINLIYILKGLNVTSLIKERILD